MYYWIANLSQYRNISNSNYCILVPFNIRFECGDPNFRKTISVILNDFEFKFIFVPATCNYIVVAYRIFLVLIENNFVWEGISVIISVFCFVKYGVVHVLSLLCRTRPSCTESETEEESVQLVRAMYNSHIIHKWVLGTLLLDLHLCLHIVCPIFMSLIPVVLSFLVHDDICNIQLFRKNSRITRI